jgi:hypothetical protein
MMLWRQMLKLGADTSKAAAFESRLPLGVRRSSSAADYRLARKPWQARS